MKKNTQSKSGVKQFKNQKIDYDTTAKWLSELFQICYKLRTENDELKLELLTLLGQKQASLWKDIETAPKDGTEILLYLGDEWQGIAVGHYGILEEFDHETDRYQTEICWQSELEKRNPTHWMPLPSIPQ